MAALGLSTLLLATAVMQQSRREMSIAAMRTIQLSSLSRVGYCQVCYVSAAEGEQEDPETGWTKGRLSLNLAPCTILWLL
jgi:hypothetical protein